VRHYGALPAVLAPPLAACSFQISFIKNVSWFAGQSYGSAVIKTKCLMDTLRYVFALKLMNLRGVAMQRLYRLCGGGLLLATQAFSGICVAATANSDSAEQPSSGGNALQEITITAQRTTEEQVFTPDLGGVHDTRAVTNAVNDALRPFGTVITEIPLTPQIILTALGRI